MSEKMSGLFSDTTSILKHFGKRAVEGQGGLLTGTDPSSFDTTDPLRVWIIQVGVIIMMAQLLSLGLRKMKQPKVIAEVLGGILLGPTAFGRIPGFTQHIFPQASRPYLSLVANIGLCLFLFIIGLEIDASIIKRNARISITVSLAGIALPFALGSALSIPLYNHFIDPSVKFTHFMLFTGVAYSITAFPVLCRILTELKLLDTTVGIVVLSAGVGDDIVGWSLLALSVALVNATTGLTALYILLICIAFTLFLLFPVKHLMFWLARKTGSLENGPSVFFMTFTVLLLWACAFFTDIIGVGSIFGAFLAGIIVPREGGLAITLTEKLEDMVTIIFLPLYFTYSGLNTNLGLLDDGVTWGFTIAIIALSFSGKFGGCTLAARYSGFGWREASTVGSLMSCKGLVELIVLNVGLSAGILSQKVFSMFVLEALTLTFMTTPLVNKLYPPERRVHIGESKEMFAKVSNSENGDGSSVPDENKLEDEQTWKSRFTVVLDKLEHMPAIMELTQMIHIPMPNSQIPTSGTSHSPPGSKPTIQALRLIELSDRTSAVMKSSAGDSLMHTDPLLRIFRTFGKLNDISISSSLSIIPYDELASSVFDHGKRHGSQLIFVPWLPLSTMYPDAGDIGLSTAKPSNSNPNPFETFFGSWNADKSGSAIHSQFVRSIFAQSKIDVALFIDIGDRAGELQSTASGSHQHVFFPFFGGLDDRLALEFVVQLCVNPKMSATIVRIVKGSITSATSIDKPAEAYLRDYQGNEKSNSVNDGVLACNGPTISTIEFPDTLYGNADTQLRLQSDAADDISWLRYASPGANIEPSSSLQRVLSRIEFTELQTPIPLHAITKRASSLRSSLAEKNTRILAVSGRSRRTRVGSHSAELTMLMEEHRSVGPEISKTIGDTATALMVSGCKIDIVVLQAANVVPE
ncbi:Sodium/hydrogen exchanger family-domain-containing protein [Hygrophoropsis aurantiaca]|uniref:Sodium/hydrogen exchanger family-domain-containing protein n=1 Tax=Hygrophoropsis aurantiaca TaxID=72124 RepID=A0ACB8AKV7_9AGAM|nr:Sodium/hydrogen exchanger family-domain-containing protein [Hygrophoropsis aurantiaca]